MLAHWPLTKAGQLKAAHAWKGGCTVQTAEGREGAGSCCDCLRKGERGKGRKLICSAVLGGQRTDGMALWRAGPTKKTATTELVSGEEVSHSPSLAH